MGDINVTPLIDVVLVLLIIYMVVTPVTLRQLEVKIPEDEKNVEQQDEDTSKQVLIAACIDDNEELVYRLNQELIEKDQIEDRIKKLVKKQVRKELNKKQKEKKEKKGSTPSVKAQAFVYGHPDAYYPQIVLLMDMVNNTFKSLDAEYGEGIKLKGTIGLADLDLKEEFTPCSEPLPKLAAPMAPTAPVPSEGG